MAPRVPTPVPLLRPLIHGGTGLIALSLGLLPHGWALAGAAFGVVAGWIILPRLALEQRLRRPGESFLCGLRTYPLAVFGLVLLLPPAEAAAAWGVLAIGDAAAAVIGSRVPAAPVFGHPKATFSGSFAYFVFGTLAALGLGHGVVALADMAGTVDPGLAPDFTRAGLAALAATLLDLVPLPPDDNIPGSAAAGSVLYFTRLWR